jgi:hypothetical protein
MSIVKDILRDERNRLVLLKDQIEEQILSLPKGSLSRKKRNNRFYYYLAYRKGDKVIFKYVGKDNSPEIASLEQDIKKRRKLEKRLREIKADLKDIKRGLGER